jgi:hypothetical protein
MTELVTHHERTAWMVAVAVLATSLCWLAAVNLAWLAHAFVAHSPAILAAARALLRVGAHAFTRGPALVVGSAIVIVVAVLAAAIHEPQPMERRVGHA